VLALELEVDRLTARVEELEQEKAQIEAFAATAAHELVEPLVMTEAYTSIVSDRLGASEHEESREDLQALGRVVSRLRLLTDSVLYEARSREHAIERRPVPVSGVVADCLVLLGPGIEAREARLDVGFLPDATGDEALISSVFSNLLINALKYSPRSGGTIRIGGESRDGFSWYFVESEGPAIPASDRERIFESYQRGRGERRANGAGLGLTICKRIVTRHGGEIGVVPLDDGHGNRFFFTLPR